MSDSPNVALARRLYQSAMAPEVTAQVLAPDLVWDITPGFPYSGIYHGWDNAAKDFFSRMMPNFTSFEAVPEEFYDAGGDHVVVFGHYHAEAKTGKDADVRFMHLWTVRDGKLAAMRQAADSHVLREAIDY